MPNFSKRSLSILTVLPDDNDKASSAVWRAVLAKTKMTSKTCKEDGVLTAATLAAVAVDESSIQGGRDGIDSSPASLVSGKAAGTSLPLPTHTKNLETTTDAIPMLAASLAPRQYVHSSSSTIPPRFLKDELRLVVAAIEEEKKHCASLHKGLVQQLTGSGNCSTSDK